MNDQIRDREDPKQIECKGIAGMAGASLDRNLLFSRVRRLVIKVGSAVVTDSKGLLPSYMSHFRARLYNRRRNIGFAAPVSPPL